MTRTSTVHTWSLIALFAAVSSVWLGVAGTVVAQPAAESQPPAEVWLSRTLQDQRRLDVFARWVAAPASVGLGAAAALMPAVTETSLASSTAYLSAGAFMLTSAISIWAHKDPDEARSAYAFWSSLGFAAFGTGLVLSCLNEDAVSPQPGFSRKLLLGAGLFDAGFFISSALTMLLMPPPAASELELRVQNLDAAGRRDRIIEFLERRDRVRRVTSFIAAPWGVAFGVYLLAAATQVVATPEKIFMYGAGAGLIAFNIGAFIYEQVRTGDADRLRAGEYP